MSPLPGALDRDFPRCVRMCMHHVDVEILGIQLHQIRRILQHEQVLSIPLLSRLGKVEGACDHRGVVDNDNFVMGDGMLVVNLRLDAALAHRGHGSVGGSA